MHIKAVICCCTETTCQFNTKIKKQIHISDYLQQSWMEMNPQMSPLNPATVRILDSS